MVTQNTQQCIGPVFFNQGSMEPKSSTKGSTGPLVVSKKINCPRHLRPLDVFSTLLVGPKCICGRGSAPNPAEGTYSAPPDPSWWGGGLLTLPKTPLPAVSFWPQISALLLRSPPPPKDMGSVSNQNCCKEFHFTEKVEKHCIRLWGNELSD